ncbi:MAG: rhamnulokinase [Aeromicrobium sp.]
MVALDLGAESGRAVTGIFDGRRLAIDDSLRFANVPVTVAGTAYWDFLRLFGDSIAGLRRAAAAGRVSSVGVDTWGVDFGLVDERGRLLANPVHYRDARTEGMPELAFQTVSRNDIYRTTGIQFLPFNTLYQLLAMVRAEDPILRTADRLLMMGDLFAHFLCGSSVAEYTDASTSQCLDASTRDWARPLLQRLGIPTNFLPEIVQPGTVLGALRADVAAETGLKGTLVVAPGSHDTASAVVGAPLSGPTTAFLSSGTWSLIGLEIARPMVSDASLAANLTNEGGVADTIRLLRNVMGLWLIQESRRAMWPSGEGPSYGELAALAETAPAFTAFIDPDDPRFLPAGDVPARVRAFCRETGQPEPPDAATLMRVLLESLALRYAQTIDELVAASGQRIEKIHVVGGGSKHQLLCRLTAGATGLPVQAGPAEATAIGNIVVQAIAAGELASIAEARELIAKSFPLVLYEPGGDWAEARERFARCAPRVPPEPAL